MNLAHLRLFPKLDVDLVWLRSVGLPKSFGVAIPELFDAVAWFGCGEVPLECIVSEFAEARGWRGKFLGVGHGYFFLVPLGIQSSLPSPHVEIIKIAFRKNVTFSTIFFELMFLIYYSEIEKNVFFLSSEQRIPTGRVEV